MHIPKIAVVGAGLMGAGIATQHVLANQSVMIHDVEDSRLREAHKMVDQNLAEMMEAGVITEIERRAALGRLVRCNSLSRIGDASIVFEAVPENPALKQSIYRSIEAVVSSEAIVASNTSGLEPDLLCGGMSRPERFLVAHFWNPPYLLPLVEVVPCGRTLQKITDRMVQQLQQIGLSPIVLKKPVAGFIGNRVQFAILREVLYLARAGVATLAEIDMVVQLTLGRRYQFAGPLASADLGGLNTMAEISLQLMPQLAKDESVIDVLVNRVYRDEIGIRSGRGFYEWTPALLADLKARRKKLLHAAPRIPTQ